MEHQGSAPPAGTESQPDSQTQPTSQTQPKIQPGGGESQTHPKSQSQPKMSTQNEEVTQATQMVSKLVLNINSGNGEDALAIKVRGKTKWAKVFASYAQAKELTTNVIRFMYDGDRIQPDNTPTVGDLLADVSTEEAQLGVTIDALVEQAGGAFILL